MDLSKVDLNKPAFGANAQKIEDLEPKETPAEDSQPEVEKVVEAEPKPEPSVEEPEEDQKVPYSRFKKFHDRALQAEAEAAEWRAKAESKPEPKPVESEDVPGYWTKLYGDSDASKEAWKIQKEANDSLIEEARQRAVEAMQNERKQEAERAKKNEGFIDSQMEALSDSLGRQLTEKEQSGVLDIVDDLTPKDKDGSYLGAPIPFDKAWEIYELKAKASRAPKIESRDKVAALTGSQSQGDPSAEEQRNKDFNPLNWDAWRSRI